MNFDKETVIAIICCVLLLLLWPTISEKMGWIPAQEEEITTETVSVPAPAPVQVQTAQQVQTVAKPAENVAEEKLVSGVLDNGSIKITIDPYSGAIDSLEFLKFKHNDLHNSITIRDVALFALETPGVAVSGRSSVVTEDGKLKISRMIGQIMLTQTFCIDSDYTISCRYDFKNTSGLPATTGKMTVNGGAFAPWHIVSGDKMRTMSHRLDLMTADGDYEDIKADEDDEDYFFSVPPSVQWAAVSNKYFCSMFKNKSGASYTLFQKKPRTYIPDSKGNNYPVIAIGAEIAQLDLQPHESKSFEFVTYTGPKDGDALAAFAADGEKVMHLAWGPLNYLARLLMWILNLFHYLCGSYGVSIILLTLLVRSIFYPLTSRGNENMRKMQKVQPMFKELKEKYKDNPQLLNQKMTELYRQEGINPLAGCLPILLQIPIFFALYAMLDNAVALRHVSFLWCKNLAAADTVCRIPLGFTMPLLNADAIPVNPLVLAMTALMVIQQRMTPMSMDPMQKKMMMFMPVIMLLFLYDLPSGLTLYWTVSNIFSIIQLWLQKKRSQPDQPAAAAAGK